MTAALPGLPDIRTALPPSPPPGTLDPTASPALLTHSCQAVSSTCTHHARSLCLCTLHINTNPSQHCLHIVASFASAYTSFPPAHVLKQSGQANLTSTQRCFRHHHLQAPSIPQHCLQYSHTHVKPASIQHPPPLQHISYFIHGIVDSIRASHISALSLGHQRPYPPEPWPLGAHPTYRMPLSY